MYRQVCPRAFASLLQYLYTGRLETAVADVDDCLRLAAQCRLTALRHQLQEHIARVDEFGKPLSKRPSRPVCYVFCSTTTMQ